MADEALKQMLEDGVMNKIEEPTPWVAPMVIVPKSDQNKKTMKQDLAQKIGTNSLIIPTDKTNNFYNMEISNYIITKDYKKADQNTPQEINLEAKHIAKSLQIKDRITTTNTTDAYITLKDHKLNFTNNPKENLPTSYQKCKELVSFMSLWNKLSSTDCLFSHWPRKDAEYSKFSLLEV
ncbi:hypothetical protein EB796_013833 [Bugula neritina]|uniref:Uncharacterized protein n=1 Tax=Bugula neritina TaxID=10212 RepID=A0A7J7JND0_BUGNE|nr:hypothetical protein EB796_013833 [Bugula neritina]